MPYWLFKSEPDTWSWDQQVAKGAAGEEWHGVRNYQARNNMKAMNKGDLVFFYHSNIGRGIVGIMEIVREHYPDPTDERFVLVDVTCKRSFTKPVTLATIKSDPRLGNIALIRQSRLSVMPITSEEWDIICDLGNAK